MDLLKVKGPSPEGREAMYYAERQDFAYQSGAYDYQRSIAMVPKYSAIAGYIRFLGLRRILDIGCGTGELLFYLDDAITYVGIDISPTAIEGAKKTFAGHSNASFVACDFREREPMTGGFDGVVWAGIGRTWTLKGKGGSLDDWSQIIKKAEVLMELRGYLIFEMVPDYLGFFEKLVDGRCFYEAGCNLDCFQSEESPKRCIRIYIKK